MHHEFTRAELVVAGALLLALTASLAAVWLATIASIAGAL